MTDDGKNYAYVYDAFGRLVGVKNRGTSAAVTNHRYNGLGYRIMWQYDADADATLEDAERYYLTYDERWRVVATFRNQDSSPKESFVFHGSGVGGRGGSWGAYIDSVILRDRDANGGGGWTGASDGTLEERRFYCQNWRADVVALMESDGDPVEWVRYSAYGEATAFPVADVNRDGVVNSTDQSDWTTLYSGGTTCAVPVDLNFDGIWPDSTDNDVFTASYNATTGSNNKGKVSTVAVGNRLGYAGYHFDPATSHYHVRHRVYTPEAGRWTRRDPLGYTDSAHLAQYGNGAAVARSDPSGLLTDLCAEWAQQVATDCVAQCPLPVEDDCKAHCQDLGNSTLQLCNAIRKKFRRIRLLLDVPLSSRGDTSSSLLTQPMSPDIDSESPAAAWSQGWNYGAINCGPAVNTTLAACNACCNGAAIPTGPLNPGQVTNCLAFCAGAKFKRNSRWDNFWEVPWHY